MGEGLVGRDQGSNQVYKFRSVHGAGHVLCSGKKVHSMQQIALTDSFVQAETPPTCLQVFR